MIRRLALVTATLAVALTAPTASAAFGSNNSKPYPETVYSKFMRDCAEGSGAAPRVQCECIYRKVQRDLTLAEYMEVETAAQSGTFDNHPYSGRLQQHARTCVAEYPV